MDSFAEYSMTVKNVYRFFHNSAVCYNQLREIGQLPLHTLKHLYKKYKASTTGLKRSQWTNCSWQTESSILNICILCQLRYMVRMQSRTFASGWVHVMVRLTGNRMVKDSLIFKMVLKYMKGRSLTVLCQEIIPSFQNMFPDYVVLAKYILTSD
ncbi:hypothetical protein DPMN_111738 [Dreissena polymorpha]|uniref:Uncharacterized protein n=1 Tax=Dreissena polymorpha TaxID=45954 RepID=A0A9D4KF04_DREPO|nr:hypothetical protein DPMN_111738 [Dreissena polymorpha]